MSKRTMAMTKSMEAAKKKQADLKLKAEIRAMEANLSALEREVAMARMKVGFEPLNDDGDLKGRMEEAYRDGERDVHQAAERGFEEALQAMIGSASAAAARMGYPGSVNTSKMRNDAVALWRKAMKSSR